MLDLLGLNTLFLGSSSFYSEGDSSTSAWREWSPMRNARSGRPTMLFYIVTSVTKKVGRWGEADRPKADPENFGVF